MRIEILVVGLVIWCEPRSFAASIAFSASLNGRPWRVFLQERQGSPPVPVTPEDGRDYLAPAIGSEGKTIAVEAGGAGIMVCAVAKRPSCESITAAGRSATSPSWLGRTSGDLLFVRYAVAADSEDSDIFATADGHRRAIEFLRHTGVLDHPRVSSDGRWLAYTANDTVGLARAKPTVVQSIWVADLEGGSARPLLLTSRQDIHPAWSPTGDRLAFASNRDGDLDIWTVKANGDGILRITQGAGTKTWPAWSPDGDTILFVRSTNGRLGLWTVKVATGELVPYEPFGKARGDVELRDPDWR